MALIVLWPFKGLALFALITGTVLPFVGLILWTCMAGPVGPLVVIVRVGASRGR